MKLKISRPAAIAAAFVAVAARVFLALALDSGPLHNGAWLSALLGAFLSIPWLLCLAGLRRDGHSPQPLKRLPLRLLLLASALLDGGVVLSAVVRSAGYLALDRVPTIGLALPVCVAALCCVNRGGDATGYGAMLWMRIFPALLLLVILQQAGHYRAQWLHPILGSGWPDIVRGGIVAAGGIVPATAVLLISDEPEDRPKRSIQVHPILPALAPLISALLLILRLMMAPTIAVGDTWLRRLDALLTNGRAPLYLQLPMIVLWYAGLLHLLLCDCFAAAALLQQTVPKIDGRLCGAIAVLSVGLISFSSLPATVRGGEILQWQYVAATMLGAICTAIAAGAKGGAEPCAR